MQQYLIEMFFYDSEPVSYPVMPWANADIIDFVVLELSCVTNRPCR